jgi:hypothetical protein
MYLPIMSEDEQQQVIRALRGPQFVRERHGSLYDRGSSDSYYGRQITPHYGGVGGDSGPRVEVSQSTSQATIGMKLTAAKRTTVNGMGSLR